MASSRIFIRGIPPTLSSREFEQHFSSQCPITDAKFFPNRRIGYVGFQTPEDAAKAVKYFNKSFIRMSKIGVEFALPVCYFVPIAMLDLLTSDFTRWLRRLHRSITAVWVEMHLKMNRSSFPRPSQAKLQSHSKESERHLPMTLN